MRIVLVSGYSGAGKSVALKTLADLGYEAMDNIPLPALVPVIEGMGAPNARLAICSDVRTRDFSAEKLLQVRDIIRERPNTTVEILFLACDKPVLQRRFTETRHRHPLSLDRPVIDGIRLEYELLQRVRDQADFVLDTSELGPHDLKRALTQQFGSGEASLKVNLVSFSFKRGVPREADMVLDARFLENPHYDDALRPLTGRNAAVQSFIRQDTNSTAFLARLEEMLDFLLPLYAREGKSYFTLAIGCTGGRHRSVYCVESLAESLARQKITCFLRHRELEG